MAEVRECSVARALELVGEKWTLLALRELMLGVHRFDEIAGYTGAPRDILTTRLRKLEENGLIERRQYQERPPRFDYHLTALGRSLVPVITVLRAWGDAHLAGESGPPLVFEHTCGAVFHPEIACEACHQKVRWRDVTTVAS
ncbi:MAG: winged helix-turn-helix transcriptional regulator [Marmoricola sp.]